jgi:hypothetical protein
MPIDPNDELARARARRLHARRPPRPDADARHKPPTEQEDAIARAREAWLLRRVGRDGDGHPADDRG